MRSLLFLLNIGKDYILNLNYYSNIKLRLVIYRMKISHWLMKLGLIDSCNSFKKMKLILLGKV